MWVRRRFFVGHHLSFVIAGTLGQNVCIMGVGERRFQKWSERMYFLFYKVCQSHMSVRSQIIGEEDAEFRGRR